MGFLKKYQVIPSYLETPSLRRQGKKLAQGVKFIVAHDTGNPKSTAANNVAYFQRTRDQDYASAHIFVDDKEILECIPALTADPEKACHVLYNVTTDNRLFGADANDAAIGVEYCYGSNIQPDEAYKRYIWVLAALCDAFSLDPSTRIIGHCFLNPQRKTDPVTGLMQSRRTYDQLLRDVSAEHARCLGVEEPAIALKRAKGTVKTRVRLNIRLHEPNTRAPIVQQVTPDTRVKYVGWTENGEPVNNNAKWYLDEHGNYFWSGGVT